MKRERKYKKALWTTLPGAKVTQPKVRRRIRQKSKRQGQRDRRYAKIRTDFLIRHPYCQVCEEFGLNQPFKANTMHTIDPSEDVHHKAGRRGDLLFDTRHFLATCRRHHDEIHSNPKWARTWGFIESQHGTH